MEISTLGSSTFINILCIHSFLYILLIYKFREFASRNPKITELNNTATIGWKKQTFLILSILLGTMFGYLFFVDSKTKEKIKSNRIIPKTISIVLALSCITLLIINLTRLSSNINGTLPYHVDPIAFLQTPIIGYETATQYYIHKTFNDFFTCIIFAVYAYNFKWSDTKWYTKIRKGIGYVLLYALVLSITDIHYFEIPELLPYVIIGILSFLLSKNYKIKKNIDNKEDGIMKKNETKNDFVENHESPEVDMDTPKETHNTATSNTIIHKREIKTISIIKRFMRNIISYLRKMFKSKTTKGETQNIEDESKCNSIIDRYNQLSNGQKWWTSICALYFFVTLLLCGIAAFDEADLGFGLFLTFDFIIPLVIYIIYFSFKNYRRKTIIFFSTISILAVITTISLVVYDIYEDKQSEIERERIENTPIINRTFLNCELGDTTKVLNAINWTVEQRTEHIGYIKINGDGTEITHALKNIEYGKYNLSRMNFFYYKDKLTEVKMQIDITYDDYTYHRTFEKIIDMFTQKAYGADYFYNKKYNNAKQYYDKFTRLKVGCYAEDGNYFVQITYYDKTSGYEEMLESGF